MKKTTSKTGLNGCSLFSSAGVAEAYFTDAGIEIVAANELLKDRAELYRHLHKNTDMIQGDILNKTIFQKIIDATPKKLDFLIASPPCQGMSVAGSNRSLSQMLTDERNFLVKKIIEFVQIKTPDYILIENVPTFLKLKLPHDGKLFTVVELLTLNFGKKYNIEARVLNSADFGVPQQRKRALIKLYKKGLSWSWPKEEKKVKTVKESIGHLPSLEAGEKSNIPWHNAKEENPRYVMSLRHTPSGQSALRNTKYYPKKENGDRIKGFHNTFKRMVWDQPAHARTTFCGSINSHNNVHPGKLKSDGTYSDARALTPLETFIVSSLPNPKKVKFPSWANATFINTIIGEGVPPLLLKKVVQQIT